MRSVQYMVSLPNGKHPAVFTFRTLREARQFMDNLEMENRPYEFETVLVDEVPTNGASFSND